MLLFNIFAHINLFGFQGATVSINVCIGNLNSTEWRIKGQNILPDNMAIV